MKRFTLFLVSGVISAALVVSGAAVPASAAVIDPRPTPVPSDTPSEGATVDLSGEITTVGDQVSAVSDSVMLFHVRDEGYLPVDFAGVQLDGISTGTITVRLAIPADLDEGSGEFTQFEALANYTLTTSPITALAILPYEPPRYQARVNQTPTAAGDHQIFAVAVTPANVSGSSASTSQSLANIQADVENTNTYWLSQSDDQIGFELAGKTSWYRSAFSCSISVSSNFSKLINEARSRATSQLGYQDAPNNHLVLFFPSGSNCGGAIGVGTIGSSVNSGGALWVIGTQSATAKETLSHELGHNMSLGHANWLECASSTPNPGYFGTNGCSQHEYGDLPDVMGYGTSVATGGSLSSAQAIRASIWPSSAYVDAPQGTNVYELQGMSTGEGLRSVTVEDSQGITYFVEFRDLEGIDEPYASISPACTSIYCTSTTPGVRILQLETKLMFGTYYKGLWGDDSQLIGRTVSGVDRTTFGEGQSFTNNGVTVAVTDISEGVATVSVTRPAITAQGGLLDLACTVCASYPPSVGSTLSGVLDADWMADSYDFQWYRSDEPSGGEPIDGATEQSYTLTLADAGSYVEVRVTSITAGSGSITEPSGFAGPISTHAIIPGTASIDADSLPFVATPADWLPGGLTFGYQWRRDGANISGATSANYTPTAADNGAELSVRITGKRSGYTNVSIESEAKDYTLTASGLPVISGTAQVGQELEVDELTYSTVDGPVEPSTETLQWLRSGAVIPGATDDSYTLTSADLGKLITARAVATASGYASSTATSEATTAVVRGDIAGDLESPVVTEDTETLEVTVGLPEGRVTELGVGYAYQWYRDGLAVTGETAATYQLTAADHGSEIHARVVVTKAGYNSATLYSAAVDYSLFATGELVVDGTARVGETLSATSLSYWTEEEGPVTPEPDYQWYRNNVVIPGANAPTYELVAADYSKKLSVRVTAAVTGLLPHSALSPQTALVVKGILSGDLADPTVEKNSELLQLTASLTAGSITDEGTATAFQWFRNGVAITGATNETYQLTAADYGTGVHVRLTVSKLNYTSAMLTSEAVDYSLVQEPAVPVFTGPPEVGETLTVDGMDYEAENDPVVVTPTYQWLRDGAAIAEATDSSYLLVEADLGSAISVRVTADYAGFLPSVSTSAATQAIGENAFDGYDLPATVTKNADTMVLTAHPGITVEDPTTLAYRWYRNGLVVTGATGTTYQLTSADYSKVIHVRVTASKPTYTTVVAFSEPANYSLSSSGSLTVTGVVRVGSELTPSSLLYTTSEGPATPSLAYRWYRNGMPISGATGETYTPALVDYGTKLSVRVTATLAGFLPRAVMSSMTAAVAKGVLSGSMAAPTVGKTDSPLSLTASLTVGSVTDTGTTTTYQWYRDGVAISGATAQSRVPTAADYGKDIHARLKISKPGYTSVSLLSEPQDYSVTPSTPVPVLVGPVAAGEELTVSARTFSAGGDPVDPDLSYQWLRDGAAIVGATGNSYTPENPADLGRAISVRMTATLAGYLSSISTSAATQKVGADYFTGYDQPATVTKNVATKTLTAVPGITVINPTTLTYRWYRNGLAISGATAVTYKLTSADYGKDIHVRVTASKAGYTSVVAYSEPLDYSVAAIGSLTAGGTARVGQTLTPSSLAYSTSEGVVTPELSYQWYRDGMKISGATSSTYALASADYTKRIQVRVTASVDGFLAHTALSPKTAMVGKGILSGDMSVPVVTNNLTTMKLSAALPGSSVTTPSITVAYQWYRNGLAISGATSSLYSLKATDYGKDIKVRVVVSKLYYSSVTLYSAVTVP